MVLPLTVRQAIKQGLIPEYPESHDADVWIATSQMAKIISNKNSHLLLSKSDALVSRKCDPCQAIFKFKTSKIFVDLRDSVQAQEGVAVLAERNAMMAGHATGIFDPGCRTAELLMWVWDIDIGWALVWKAFQISNECQYSNYKKQELFRCHS